MSTNNAFDVTPAGLIPLCRTILESGKVPFVLGPPGLGKSTMASYLAAEANRPFRDIRLAYYSPTDVGGMPYLDRDTNSMKFAPMGLLPTEAGSFIMLDEFPLAPRATQNAALQLVLDGRVGDYVLPPDTWIMMAGNRSEDRCFGDRLSPAMINRVVVIRLKPSLEDWVEWAFDADIDPILTAYVRFNPASLLDFDPTKWDGETNFASPRSWEALNKVMQTSSFKKLPRDLRRILICGTIGTAAGNEFCGYLEVYEDLPSLESVLIDPDTAPLPKEASAKIAAAAMISNHTTAQTLAPLMRYASRFEKMFEVFYIKSIVARNSKLLATADLIRWVTSNKDVFQS